MKPFLFDEPAHRVIFGVGSLDRLADEVKRFGAVRALVLATPEQQATAEEASADRGRLRCHSRAAGGEARSDRSAALRIRRAWGTSNAAH